MNLYSSIMNGLKEAIEYEKDDLKGVKRHIVSVKPLTVYKANEIKKYVQIWSYLNLFLQIL